MVASDTKAVTASPDVDARSNANSHAAPVSRVTLVGIAVDNDPTERSLTAIVGVAGHVRLVKAGDRVAGMIIVSIDARSIAPF